MLRIPGAILAAVPEGPLTRDARLAQSLLTDPARTAMVLVTLAEDLPANEAAELYRAVTGSVGIAIARLVVNQVWPDRFTRDGAPAAIRSALAGGAVAGDAMLGPLIERAETTRERRRLNERVLHKLEREVPVPQVQLPLLHAEEFGAAEVEVLSHLL